MKKNKIILLLFLLAFLLRLYGLNWDQGQHLHPDERFLTMVTTDIKLPDSIVQYFNNQQSPLNPYNYPSYQFFVYGTFPIFLTKVFAVVFQLDNYENIVLVGRALSAFLDSVNIFLLYFFTIKILGKKSNLLFLPSILYAFCVLPIQLSHFFAVDTFLNTFILSTFVLLTYNLLIPASITFGLALACKISALYFLPIIFVFLIIDFIKNKKYFRDICYYIILLLVAFTILRIFQPYIFDGLYKVNNQFIDNIKQLKVMGEPGSNFPPAVQWLSKTRLLFPFQNFLYWGFGLPLSLGFITLLVTRFNKILSNRYVIYSFIWVFGLFIYQGSTFTPTMRYFLFIYPFIIVIFIYLLSFRKNNHIYLICILFHILYGLAFINIYIHPHTRVDASVWIYSNIKENSKITNEYWDDPLPLSIMQQSPHMFNQITIAPYDYDSQEKIDKLYQQINSADYVLMSSNRLWGSIPLVPNLYPYTSMYYRDLFSSKLKFDKELEINSYPGFSLPFLTKCYYFGPSNFPGINNKWFDIDQKCRYPGIYLRDDTAEEAFTVYDHPKVLIFSRTNQ